MDLKFISISGTTLAPSEEYTELIDKIIHFFKYPLATGGRFAGPEQYTRDYCHNKDIPYWIFSYPGELGTLSKILFAFPDMDKVTPHFGTWNEIHEAAVHAVPTFVFSKKPAALPVFRNIKAWVNAKHEPELISIGLGGYPLWKPIRE